MRRIKLKRLRIAQAVKGTLLLPRPNDPLHVLREDTYSNEETDEMVGRMFRNQQNQQNNEQK